MLPSRRSIKRKVTGGFLAVVGYMLSPLSWWNDLFVNIPLAIAFAWVVSLVYKPAFTAALAVGYLLTNQPRSYSRRDLLRDVAVSLAYTGLILALAKFGIIKPITDYFKH